MIKIGNGVLFLKTDNTELDKGLGAAKKSAAATLKNIGDGFTSVGKKMAVAGGIVVGVLGTMITNYANAGDEVQKMALRTGISTESLSEFRHAAELSGTSLGDMETGIRKMQRSITEAGEEWRKSAETGKAATGTYTEALEMLGLSFQDLEGLSPEQQFTKITSALADVGDATRKAAIAQELFGRSGTSLLPMLADGSKGLAKMRQEAHDLGLVFSQDAANQAAEFNDMLTRLKGALQGASFELAQTLVPILVNEWIPALVDGVKRLTAWIRENKELVATITKVVGAAGVLMVTLGPVLIVIGSAIKIIAALHGGFTLLTGAMGAAAGAGGIGAILTALGGAAGLIIVVGFTVVAIKELIATWKEWKAAHEQKVESFNRLQESTRAFVRQMEALNIEVDKNIFNMGSEAEKTEYLSQKWKEFAQKKRQMTRSMTEDEIAQLNLRLAAARKGITEEEEITKKSIETQKATAKAHIDTHVDTAMSLDALLKEYGYAEGEISTITGTMGDNVRKAVVLSERHSPSVLDLVGQSLFGGGGLVSLYTDAGNTISRILGGIINMARQAINMALRAVGMGGGGGGTRSYASGTKFHPGGLAYVHADELLALPRGTQVYTKNETKKIMNGGMGDVSVNVNMGGVVVREEADIGKIGRELARNIKRDFRMRGGPAFAGGY